MFRKILVCVASMVALGPLATAGEQQKTPIEITTSMKIDVDGAPNAYGPKDKPTLDDERNAHAGARYSGEIVGYLTKADGRTAEIQTATDPFPGYYISISGYYDHDNANELDPRRYVDASKINYVVLGSKAKRAGVVLGDFVAVYSMRTHKRVFGIVGDSGNASGAEGSLALLQALGYPFKTGKTGEVGKKEVSIRYFPGSNPAHRFYKTQEEIDKQAYRLGLSRDSF